ncbi:MAG: peptidase S41 [Citromicrobium sp.]|jgi:carboxyl-terminal processing protease|nr:peptidase S41 [Citromicrobium sp.]MAO97252.1 peptidase S41 [Citromicrobium sp.]MAS84503.1 peptidase S41 [Erythrobacteraceae bacterium]MBD75597.1 peptidase S41 [Citromicrobium sp.]MBT45707.1 peptidase S41 [Citromicrobium sp.]|tara:strand:- start:44964 stop:46301 length:1338 start_codon:yes stop_codon:yes gene_type:complete
MKLPVVARSLAFVSALAMVPIATAGMAQVDSRVAPEFAKLFATYQRIKASYVDPVDDDKLIRGAIDGMLASLDPHSAYLDGADLQRLETLIDGNYSGLGLSVVMEEGAVKVVSPFRGSPAEKAGIKAGDFITHLNGKLIYGGDLDDAVSQMRGPAGTSINLTIFRPGSEEPIETTVTRGVIELEPVTHTVADGGIGIITVNEFSRDVGADVYAAWGEIQKEVGGKVNGLILDLRSNPGGSLDEAVALSDLFLDEGRIVSQRGRARGESITYNSETMFRGQIAPNVPLIVLIDAGSASASEIVAGALQDHRRALIMGERSFGKGSVQSLVPLGDDAALKLTTARYYTPSGHSVQEGGIKPDIRVPQISDPDMERRMKYQLRESDLRGHLINEADLKDDDLERDLKADPRFSQTSEQLKEQGIEDFQLDYAIKTLRRTTASSVALLK